MTQKNCKHKGTIRIGEKEWEWCYLFNAKIDDVDCAKCDYSHIAETSAKIESLTIV